MNILPILNPTHTLRSDVGTVFTSAASPATEGRIDGDIWNEVDWDGSCLVGVHVWSTQANDWVQTQP